MTGSPHRNSLLLRTTVGAVFILLYAPLLTLIIYSFNDSKRNVVWRGFTTIYYERAWHNDALFDAMTNTLAIATASTIVSVLLGTLVALFLRRYRGPGKSILEGTLTLPIVVPEICLGVAMMVFFNKIGWPTNLVWPLSLSAVAIAHISFSFPFAAVVIGARLATIDRAQSDAARDLGADKWHVFRDILLPHLKPSLIAAALICFTLSLDDFVVTFFTSGPNSVTLPVKIYSMVRFSVTPEINAASTALILATLLTTAFAVWILARINRSDAPWR